MGCLIVKALYDPRKDIAVNLITPDDEPVVVERWTERPIPLGRVVVLWGLTFIVALAIGFFLGAYVFCKIKGPIKLHTPVVPLASNAVQEPPKQDHAAEAKSTAELYPYYSDVAKGNKFSCAIYKLYGDGRIAAYSAAAYQVSGLTDPAHPWLYVGQRIYFPAFIIVNGKKIAANFDRAKHRTGHHCGSEVPTPTPHSATENKPVNAALNADVLPATVSLELSELYPAFPLGIQVPEPPQPAPPIQSARAVAADGYRIIIPRNEASGIRLKKELQTCIVVPENGIAKRDCQFSSWAKRTKGHAVELSVYIPELPDRPFRIIVASAKKPFDGSYFTARAKPFNGHIPGPSKFNRGLAFARGMGIRGGIGMLTMGPIGGAAFALGPPVIHTFINHFAARKDQ